MSVKLFSNAEVCIITRLQSYKPNSSKLCLQHKTLEAYLSHGGGYFFSQQYLKSLDVDHHTLSL